MLSWERTFTFTFSCTLKRSGSVNLMHYFLTCDKCADAVSRSELDQLLALAKFSGFTRKAEMYIRQAIEEPQLPSEYLVTEVCRCLTGRACGQSDHTHNAAVLIHHIMQFLAKERHAV